MNNSIDCIQYDVLDIILYFIILMNRNIIFIQLVTKL